MEPKKMEGRDLLGSPETFWYLGFSPRTRPIVGQALEGQSAQKAGILPGDEILKINGQPTPDWLDLVKAIQGNGDPLGGPEDGPANSPGGQNSQAGKGHEDSSAPFRDIPLPEDTRQSLEGSEGPVFPSSYPSGDREGASLGILATLGEKNRRGGTRRALGLDANGQAAREETEMAENQPGELENKAGSLPGPEGVINQGQRFQAENSPEGSFEDSLSDPAAGDGADDEADGPEKKDPSHLIGRRDEQIEKYEDKLNDTTASSQIEPEDKGSSVPSGKESKAVPVRAEANQAANAEEPDVPAAQAIIIELRRGGQVLTMEVVPTLEPSQDLEGRTRYTRMLGISPTFEPLVEELGPLEALKKGILDTLEVTLLTFRSVEKLISRKISAKVMGGPIMIAELAGKVVRGGLADYFAFMAFISVNLAILNILPLPVLDGGQFLFFVIEGIKRRPISLKVREVTQWIGVTALAALMILVFYNDISRLVTKFSDPPRPAASSSQADR
jgi:membrane-associated protease RseP (regulator of RpoE activity)